MVMLEGPLTSVSVKQTGIATEHANKFSILNKSYTIYHYSFPLWTLLILFLHYRRVVITKRAVLLILWESVLSDCWSGRQNGKFIQCACAAPFDVEESFCLKGIPSNDGELPPDEFASGIYRYNNNTYIYIYIANLTIEPASPGMMWHLISLDRRPRQGGRLGCCLLG